MGWFILTPGLKYQNKDSYNGVVYFNTWCEISAPGSYNGMVYFNTWSEISAHGQLQWDGLF